MRKPELLSPAGTFEKMQYAFAFGADAVYAGVPRFSLRTRENDFTQERLQKALEYAHNLNKQFYLTMNIFPHNRKVEPFLKSLDTIAKLKPDALIMSDPGMISEAREKYPDLVIHLSTQSNTINWRTVKFWKDLGLKRIILSRELSIDEIKEIKQHVPDIELEIFVHGAICIAYSGRCLLSNYFTHRDANQGSCTNACRWQYNLYQEPKEKVDKEDTYLPLNHNYYLEETERAGSLMPVTEDEHGTYIMNAKDLSTIGIIKDLYEAGIDSFKIEGRTKSVYYVSTVTRAYRRAIDEVDNGEIIDKQTKEEVKAVANRGYVSGFLEKNPVERGQNYKASHSGDYTHTFAGIVDEYDKKLKKARIRVRNRFRKGDKLELITLKETIPFTVNAIEDKDGNLLDIAHGGGVDVVMDIPEFSDDFALIRRPFIQS
jgi:putative protease